MTELDDEESELAGTADDEQWTVMKAACNFLLKLSECVGEAVWEPTATLFQEKMANQQSWKESLIGLSALAAVIPATNNGQVGQYFSQAFPCIRDLAISHQASRVRLAAMWVMHSICKHLPEVVYYSEQHLAQLTELAIHSLGSDNWQIKAVIASSLAHIFEACHRIGQS